jgi:AAA family ATP:ADP antiporter
MPERLRKLDRLLEAAFRLHPGEMWPTLLMFSMSLATVGAFIVGRSVRDTLFLAGVPVSQLPHMYVWASLAVATAGALYARIATRVRIDRLVVGTSLLFAATVAAARAALPLGGLVLHVLYVWVEVAGSIAVLQFWTFANEAYDSREARRLFGLIGAGGMLANVVAGFAVSGLARRVGAENLLFLCAALFAASAALVPLVSRAIGARHRRRAGRPRHGSGAPLTSASSPPSSPSPSSPPPSSTTSSRPRPPPPSARRATPWPASSGPSSASPASPPSPSSWR